MRKSKASWFKPKTTYITKRARNISSKKRKNAIVGFLAFFLISLILIILIGILVFSAYSLKTGKTAPVVVDLQDKIRQTPLKIFLFESEEKKLNTEYVIGLKDVKSYPNAEFIFEEYVSVDKTGDVHISPDLISDDDGQALYTFISSGQSVYRVPLDTTWDDVISYYEKALTEDGWNKVSSVPVSDFDRIPGEYYTKDSKGLHIYQISYDIWYETITVAQAENGLQDKVVAYKAKEELVAAASGKNIPSETFWNLKYSRDWDIELQDNSKLAVKNIYFSHDRSKERMTLVAVKESTDGYADLTYSDLEQVGVDYIVPWLTTQPASVRVKDFSRTQLTVAGSKAIEFYYKEKNAHFLVIYHRKKDLYYVLQYIGTVELDFYQYIIENLKVIDEK